MTEQPGLFALPDPPSAPPARAPRDRGRRGEHWTRTVVADLHIVDSRALREATYRLLSESITINLGPANDDPDRTRRAPRDRHKQRRRRPLVDRPHHRHMA